MGPEPETAGAKGATFAGFAMMPALSLAPPVASARVGADADIIVFDPAAVRDNSTIERDTIPAAGIYRVVFRYAKVLTNVQAGQAIRRPACWGMMVQGTRHSIQYPSAMRCRLWCTAAGLRR